MDLHRATQVGIEPAGGEDTKIESQPTATHSENAPVRTQPSPDPGREDEVQNTTGSSKEEQKKEEGSA